MPYDLSRPPKVLAIFLELSQYPILAPQIRAKMRQELFARGVITNLAFEHEVRERAMRSQELEGLVDPFAQESSEDWERRMQTMRDNLTDFYFAYNLPHELFKNIVQSVVTERNPNHQVFLTFNPELAPLDMVLAQGEGFEALAPEEKAKASHHLHEMIVVLLKSLITDQLDFVRIAKEFFTISDFREIRQRRIGDGKIGGKAAGMLLAYKILQKIAADEGIDPSRIVLPESYYVGANVLYEFNLQNGFFFSVDQKYKTREEIEEDYPRILQGYLDGKFPQDHEEKLRELIKLTGKQPIIVRSSSLLEDSFGRSFAGKYESIFCPNQGNDKENLDALTTAIKTIYASVLGPDPLAYRRKMGLLDYDERMAILIQTVQGDVHNTLLYPTLAGVGYSRNPFRWNPQIRREDGFLRLVWGLGTRAVDRIGSDHARMIALSHPHLRPEVTADEIRKYSQRFVDVLDLEYNDLITRPTTEIFSLDDHAMPYLVSVDQQDYIQPLFSDVKLIEPEKLVLTFDGLLKKTDFVRMTKAILRRLEKEYGVPVDIEFTADITLENGAHPRIVFHILQCRPSVSTDTNEQVHVPTDIPAADKIFSAHRLVPQGIVSKIRYLIYVSPEKYSQVAMPTIKLELARLVGRLNKRLEGETFVLMGPGRWGSSNIDLGVPVSYADINNARVLIEVASPRGQGVPDVSYGTHFFQDLVEAKIFPLPLFMQDSLTVFNRDFFAQSPNVLAELLPDDEAYANYVQVIDVPSVANGRHLEIVMDEARSEALGYLK